MQKIHKEHLDEPWFSLVLLGLKRCEGRLYKNRFKTYQVGDIIVWYNENFEKLRVTITKIIEIGNFKTFEEYLSQKELQICLPGIPNTTHGLSVYYRYYTKEDENQYGVVSFTLEPLKYKIVGKDENAAVLGYANTIDECYKIVKEGGNKHFDILNTNDADSEYYTLEIR